MDYDDLLANIEHAAECGATVVHPERCDCYRASVVELVARVRKLEREQETWKAEFDLTAQWQERATKAEANLTAAREAWPRLRRILLSVEHSAGTRRHLSLTKMDAALATDAPAEPWVDIGENSRGADPETEAEYEREAEERGMRMALRAVEKKLRDNNQITCANWLTKDLSTFDRIRELANENRN